MAWRFVKWALAQDPTLQVAVARELGSALRWQPTGEVDPASAVLARFGRVDGATRARITQEVLRDVVAPVGRALLSDLPISQQSTQGVATA